MECFWNDFLISIGIIFGLLVLGALIGLAAHIIEEKSSILLAILFIVIILIIAIGGICFFKCLK